MFKITSHSETAVAVKTVNSSAKIMGLLLTFLLMAPNAWAAVDFLTTAIYPTGSTGAAESGISADFDGDGSLDLAVANRGPNNVSVLLSDGAGGFNVAVNIAVGSNPLSVTSADFDGDGDVDLAVANSGSHNVSVLLGDGLGGFNVAVNFTTGTAPVSVTSADFDGDGDVDLAVANGGSNSVSVLLGDGLGGFNAPVNFVTGVANGAPRSVVAADFDGNGDIDLAVGGENQSSNLGMFSIFLSDGLGGFNAAVNFATGGSCGGPCSATSADFDGDGNVDLAATNNSTNNVGVLFGDGLGSFNAAVIFAVREGPGAIVAADFDGDNNIDLAVVNMWSGSDLSILLADGTGGFNPAVTIPGGAYPEFILAADFDGDGYVDLVATNDQYTVGGSIIVLPGDGAGDFNQTGYSVTDYGNPYSVTAADFDGDGNIDLATANESSAPGSGVSVLLNDGAGGLNASVDFAAGTHPCSITSADFDGDGNIDLATGNPGSSNVSVLLGDGLGGFNAPVNFSVGSIGCSIVSADFDGDGDIDLASIGSSNSDVIVLLGDGLGGFAAVVNFAVGSNPLSVTSADFDGDGDVDLAVGNYGSNNVSILLGDGLGSFTAAVNFATGTQPRSVTSADFDGDGDVDLAVANGGSNSVSILLGDGLGGFAAVVNFAAGTFPSSVTSADFDGDGDVDLAVANVGGNNVSILSGDGLGGFAAAVSFAVAGSHPVSVISADFDGDVKPDLAVAAQWSHSVGVLLNKTIVITTPSDDFVIKINTNLVSSGGSTNTQFTIPTATTDIGSGYNYNVDCNDDGFNEATAQTGSYTCDYNNLANGAAGGAGVYTVRIKDNTGVVGAGFPRIYFAAGPEKFKIISLDQWGTGKWTSMEWAFRSAVNMQTPATDTPDLLLVSNMRLMFDGATNANPDTSGWDTSNVTDMGQMFNNATNANPDTSGWLVGNVTNMSYMFYNAYNANPDTSGWDISNVVSMAQMFYGVTLPTTDYDAMLIGFNNQTLKPNVNFHGGNSKYCDAAAAWANMDGAPDNWTITDTGQDCTPAMPASAPDLQAASDLGTSNTDNLTSNNLPSFDVVCSEAGNTITLYSDNPSANTVSGTHVCVGTGTEAIMATILVDGIHNISHSESKQGDESAQSTTLAVTIDTSVANPTISTAPNPANNGTVVTTTITGLEPGTVVTIPGMTCSAESGGTVTCTETVSSSTTPNAAVTITDAAGNTNSGTTTGLTVDNTAPATPSCTTSPNPADIGTAITTSCTGVESGAIVTIPNMTCVSTGATTVDCTGTIGTAIVDVSAEDDAVTITDAAGNADGAASTGLNIVVFGDCNGDSVVDILDVTCVINLAKGSGTPNGNGADTEPDGDVDFADVITTIGVVLAQ